MRIDGVHAIGHLAAQLAQLARELNLDVIQSGGVQLFAQYPAERLCVHV